MMRWSDSETALQFLPERAWTPGRLNLELRYGARKADESKSKTVETFAAKHFQSVHRGK
ncbi:hypothetical protein MUO71_01150 [Candidatus Bathyarchaeota archaeon]|nr:hypothetical protein [Candidatus Bathyarchaeota archaeon]